MDTRTSLFSGILLSSALLATGCGGGSDSTSATPNYSAPTVPVALSQDNAVAIASSVLSGGNMAEGLSQMVSFKAGTSGSNSRDASYQRIYDLALTNALKGLSSAKTTLSVPVGITPTPVDCPAGGTTTMGWNDLNGDGAPGAGESFSITNNNCTTTYTFPDGTTETNVSNGSFTFTITAMIGDPTIAGTDWNFGMSFAMDMTNSYSDTAGNSGSSSSSGGATLTTSYVAATTETSGRMSGTNLTESFSWSESGTSGGGAFELADFNFAVTDKTSDNSYTADIDYTLRASEIGGSVTVATNPVFAGIGVNPPTSGTMVITGADGTSLTLVANSDGTVTLTVNGATQTLTWADLGGW